MLSSEKYEYNFELSCCSKNSIVISLSSMILGFGAYLWFLQSTKNKETADSKGTLPTSANMLF